MNRFSVWNQVKVSNQEHPRAGQAGVVHATHPDKPNECAVKFDDDGVVVVMTNTDLLAL